MDSCRQLAAACETYLSAAVLPTPINGVLATVAQYKLPTVFLCCEPSFLRANKTCCQAPGAQPAALLPLGASAPCHTPSQSPLEIKSHSRPSSQLAQHILIFVTLVMHSPCSRANIAAALPSPPSHKAPQESARMSTGQAITTSAQVCAACRGASTATAGSQRAGGHAEGPGSCQGASEGPQDEPPQAAAHHRCPAGPALQGLCPQGFVLSLLLDVTQQVRSLPALLLLSLPIQILTVSSVQRTFILCPFPAVQPLIGVFRIQTPKQAQLSFPAQ